ncbi:hypothetical protein L9F63_003624 [Diploptera punctata]|uniref:RecA family profile 1 domain-containing protein n=1 Tax=Diploptera punctata TaxID=6984 RepID=A0AAD8E9P6_DIPPU|nr:hypothetical protein L9F63_003624 [Diploptera punctata]
MDYECKAESGLQLLARLSSRPDIHGLDEKLFSGGLHFGDVVEITGDIGSGKTLLITQLLAKCLLPKSMFEIDIGGLGAGAIIINSDHHFQLLKLVSIMESTFEENQQLDSSTIEKIIKTALANLIVLNCYDRVQLLVTFHSLDNILSSNKNISLIVVDSLSAFYWQDIVISGIHKMDFYLKKTLKTLQSCIQEHKIVIIYTKQAHFVSKINFVPESSKSVLGNITHRVQLNRMEGKGTESLCVAEITTLNSECTVPYRLTGEGLMWSS